VAPNARACKRCGFLANNKNDNFFNNFYTADSLVLVETVRIAWRLVPSDSQVVLSGVEQLG